MENVKFFSKQSPEAKPPKLEKSLELVTIVIVISVLIGGFSGEYIKWLAHATVSYSQLSDHNFED